MLDKAKLEFLNNMVGTALDCRVNNNLRAIFDAPLQSMPERDRGQNGQHDI
jgi:hypothetical protein